MRILKKAMLWVVFWILWLPLLILELFRDPNDWGPGGDIPYSWTASLGITIWIVPFMINSMPFWTTQHWVAYAATFGVYLVIGAIALWKLDIGVIKILAPR